VFFKKFNRGQELFLGSAKNGPIRLDQYLNDKNKNVYLIFYK